MDLGEKIIIFRAVNNLSQEEFAQKIGISRYTIMDIEGKKVKTRRVTQRKIEMFLENNQR